ncbi:MAG TPA: type II toxin-antitoxin system prevent-host-death family antitoxin [Solirubrobacteraceae bacterium]|nr:type II toxin-antitoxin system prevent-host-death family antitoxin [Solirubrobacteraceae bacterium]
MASTVGVRELRQNLSKYLARVKEGETLDVTERGQVVARLSPSGDIHPKYAELAEKLGMKPPTGRFSDIREELLAGPDSPPGEADELLAWVRGEHFD